MLQLLGALVAAAIAAFAARYGIVVPPAPPSAAPLPTEPFRPPDARPDIGPSPGIPPDAPAAIGRIQFGSSGCTATVIGPRRDDGRYWVLTAAHCVQRIGQTGTMRMLDGRTLGIVAVALDRESDCCWCSTETNSTVLPYANLAAVAPAVGTRIWHAGYGIDRPGSREEGRVDAGPDQRGQIRMTLSVSSGDSGGGICVNDSGEVVSTVCCTTNRGGVGSVWGAGPEAIRRVRPAIQVMDDWAPLDVPLRMAPAP